MGTTKHAKNDKGQRVKKPVASGTDYDGLSEGAIEFSTSLRADEAFHGKKPSGLTVIKECGKWIANGQLPPEGLIRDYLVRFCERIGNGETLSKALGSQRRTKFDNKMRDFMIAFEIDEIWLFADTESGETRTLDEAIEIVRKKYKSHYKLSHDRVKKIYKNFQKETRLPGARDLCNIHDQKIMNRVTQRMRDKKESVDTAFFFVEAELNPRCQYSD